MQSINFVILEWTAVLEHAQEMEYIGNNFM